MEYKRFEIDLSVANNDLKLDFGGVYSSYHIVRYDVDFQYRINSINSPQIYASEIGGFDKESAFKELYITNTPQAAGSKAVIVVF